MAHIPASETNAIAVLSFEEAMAMRTEPCDYDRDAWLYVPDTYSEYRYILGTKGKNPLICIGINPSTARPGDLDNTLKSVERIALHNGYDSFIMFNVYAQRATDPKHMEKTCNAFLHEENMKAFRYCLSLSAAEGISPSVWAAWGTIINARPYLQDCVRDMIAAGLEYNAGWYTAGARSKNGGHPHHPLYLRKDALLDAFDVQAYVDTLGAE